MEHSELLLMALFAVLYFYDSVMLLHGNEAVLSRRGPGRWSAGFGSSTTTLKGKEVYFPNPFLPTQPLVRLRWRYEGSPAGPAQLWDARLNRFSGLSGFVWILAFLIFVMLPVALFGRQGERLIVLAFGMIYATTALMVLFLWFRRRQFEYTVREFSAIAIDLLICPPFALNIIRRLALRTPISEDFVLAAKRLLSSEQWESTCQKLLSRLDDEIAMEDEGSQRMLKLIERRGEFTVGAGHVPD